MICGPTGVGKTEHAISLAKEVGSPIISCDSRQMYREMTIGTAVPSKEQLAEVRHHFIQTISVRDAYSAGQYESDALTLIERLFAEGGHETLVMCGGSGFYIDAVCNGAADVPEADASLRAALKMRLSEEGLASLQEELRKLDPAGFESMDTANPARVLRGLEVCIQTGRPYSSFKPDAPKRRDFEVEKICLTRKLDDLYDRIDRRVDAMADAGLEDEAASLHSLRAYPAMQTVGYQEFFALFAIQGRMDATLPPDAAIRDAASLPFNAPRPSAIPAPVWPLPHSTEEALDLIRRNTRHYAKKQLSWWRRDPSVRFLQLD